MPRIEELPMPAQREIWRQRGELGESTSEKQRMSLLQRLAPVGSAAREGRGARCRQPAAQRAPPHAAGSQLPPPAAPPARCEKREPVSEYARPPRAPQGLDLHGRQAPVHNSAEDDQLEIPAFLRRQAN